MANSKTPQEDKINHYKKNMKEKTSKEWCVQFGIAYNTLTERKLGAKAIFTILSPDGWDRKNFNHSFGVEKISLAEFKSRVNVSTLSSVTDEGRAFLN